jgi:DNA-binding winged helix-turn-helix (wHTH) protein/Tol biopolymer transport system component
MSYSKASQQLPDLMSSDICEERRYSFGEFTLDATKRLLYRNGELVKLRPKLLDLLILLVERKGAVVSNDEIIRLVWPTTVVEESGLTRNVSLLRKCLGCVGGRYIENIPRRGYRFAGQLVEALGCESQDPQQDSLIERTPIVELPVLISHKSPSRSGWRPRILIAVCVVLLGSSVLLSASWLRMQHPPAPVRAVQLTTNAPELPIISGAISPDGRYLAFGEDAELYVKQIGYVETHRLQMPPHTAARTIDWFGDSSNLLASGFDTNAQQSIVWLTCVLGGPPKILFTDATLAGLSHDSKQIVFVRDRNQLWLAKPDGTDARLFAVADDGRVRFSPRFSRDGQYLLVAVERNTDSHTVIRSYRIADGQSAVLLEPDDAVMDIAVTQADELLISSLIDEEISTRLTRVQVDFAQSKIGVSQTLAEWMGAESHGLQISADGTRISFVRNRTQSDVYVADLDANGTAVSNIKRLTLDESKDRLSGWLADSRTVLFHSNRSGVYGLYRQAIDQTRAQPLLVNERDNFRAVVSPDQHWLWYYSSPANEYAPIELLRRPLSGGEPLLLSTADGLDRGLRCVSGGVCVRMESKKGSYAFYSFDPATGAGGELVTVPTFDGGSQDWSLSPDGSKVALIDGPHYAITVMDIGRQPVNRTAIRIPNGHPSIYSIAWDAHGTGLYVVCVDEYDAVLLHVGLGGDTIVMLHRPDDPVRWVIPSPDGRHLAMQAWTNAPNVWMLEANR